MIQDRYTGTWGGTGTPAVPALKHTHKAPDGFFIPGLRDDSRKIPSFDNVAAVFESALIKLGANATQGSARLGDATSAAAGMLTWMSQVAAAINAIAPGAIAPPAPLDFGTITEASTKVLIE